MSLKLRDRPGNAQRKWLGSLGIITAVGMFIVLLMGATVTNTGSAEGCGGSWPLCNGRFIPEFAVSTLIEFSHRAVTGVEGILIVALTLGALVLVRGRRDVQVLALLMIVFLFLQAGMGAAAVISPESAVVLALHFGISLIAFASTALSAIYLRSGDLYRRLRLVGAPGGLGLAIWGTTIYTYLVVYSGAYVRHADMSLNCADWPLCGGQLVPDLAGPAAMVFVHRLAAALLVLLTAWLLWKTSALRQKRPDLFGASVAACALTLLQAFAGAIVVFTRLSLLSALFHAGAVALLFAALSFLCLQTLPLGRRTAKALDAGDVRMGAGAAV